jgi:CubicO group peptidase (beta-lactamase class C family)
VETFAVQVERALAAVIGDHLAPPRMAVGRVENGTVTHFHGHDATENTQFRIASMTKSFTAAAVLHIRDAGIWRLDDQISRWVPETIDLVGPTTDSPPVTLRHLMSMSAGMSTDDPWGDRLLDLDPAGFGTLMRAPAMFATVPGTAMQYSNYGYALLGEAILRATRRTPQRYITDELLTPLGLRHTTWTAIAGHDNAGPAPRAENIDELEPLGDGAFAPMGGLWSTVTDLAKWVSFFADAFPARDGADSPVLCRATRREMQQAQTSWPPNIDITPRGPRIYELAYGFGLMINEHPTMGKLVNHSGGLPGYGSNMRWSVDAGVGFVALANRTYAPMRPLTLELIESAAHEGAFAARERGWPTDTRALRAAGDQLINAILRADGPCLDGINFAFNVDLDNPLAFREAAALVVLNTAGGAASLGSAEHWELTPVSATQGDFTTQTTSHTVKLTVLLNPEVPPLVQRFEFVAIARPEATRSETPENSAGPGSLTAT